MGNSIGSVNLLVEHGAVIDASDKDGHTPLHVAATRNDPDMIDSLLSTSDGDLAEDESSGSSALLRPARVISLEPSLVLLILTYEVRRGPPLCYSGDARTEIAPGMGAERAVGRTIAPSWRPSAPRRPILRTEQMVVHTEQTVVRTELTAERTEQTVVRTKLEAECIKLL
ncbi:hypothetical protein EV121DRAFT_291834 [Schizophyllum commune]